MQPEMIADYACVTGEGPLWHPDQRCVYWVDIPPGKLYRYDPATGQHGQVYEEAPLGGYTIQADGSLLLFLGKGEVRSWNDGEVRTIIPELEGELDSRFNDVIADPRGRVFCGTMSSESHKGRLYRLDPDGSIRVVLEGIGTSNGLGFTPDRKQMYYTDSPALDIYLFDYDEETGEISNQRVFVHSDERDGVPDGMTVDAEGYVWSAHWGGSCVIRYAPEGVEDRRILFPAQQVSCVTFGGEDYADMYVTTAGGHRKDELGAGAGALYRLRLGIRGVPEFRSRIGL